MCGTILETSQALLFVTVLSMLAAVLAVEGNRTKGAIFDVLYPLKRAPLCGFSIRTSRDHYLVRTHRAVKAL